MLNTHKESTGTGWGRRKKKSKKWEQEVGQDREGRSRTWFRGKGRKHHKAFMERKD